MTGASALWLGHATVLIEIDGVRILTDPLLRTRVAHIVRDVPLVTPPGGQIDAVFCSHAHADHLDPPSLSKVDPDVPLIGPVGIGTRVGGDRRVIELAVGDTYDLGRLRIEATEADHDGRRVPLGSPGSAIGALLRGSRSVYFAGDTDLFDGMSDLGPVDCALIPVWGWGPRTGDGHLDPEEAAEVVARVRPRLAIPIHWRTYRPAHTRLGRRPRWLDEPGPDFARHCASSAPDAEVRVIEVGERVEVP